MYYKIIKKPKNNKNKHDKKAKNRRQKINIIKK